MNSSNIVISQPMFFPWKGLFEQLALCDVFVHYDDVQFPQGRSFMNRVQIITNSGIQWLTIPIDRKKSGKNINETVISYSNDWQNNHVKTLRHIFSHAPFRNDVIEIVHDVYFRYRYENLSELNIYAFEKIASYLELDGKVFYRSSKLNIPGKSTQRLLDICKTLKAKKYITGHGAKNYFDHDLFESEDINVDYMNYQHEFYKQQYQTDYTPYVSILDLIASQGDKSRDYLVSKSQNWKEFIYE